MIKSMFSEILDTRLGSLKGLSGKRDDDLLDDDNVYDGIGDFGMGVPDLKDLVARRAQNEPANGGWDVDDEIGAGYACAAVGMSPETLRGAFRELGPVEKWSEPDVRETTAGLCAPSIHLPQEPEA